MEIFTGCLTKFLLIFFNPLPLSFLEGVNLWWLKSKIFDLDHGLSILGQSFYWLLHVKDLLCCHKFPLCCREICVQVDIELLFR